MTREDIVNMKPGRELDALVAEYVVGMKEHRKAYPESFDERVIWFGNPPNVTAYYVPFYSTDISAAWEVVEKMREEAPPQRHAFRDMLNLGIFAITPEAICKASLLAVMSE